MLGGPGRHQSWLIASFALLLFGAPRSASATFIGVDDGRLLEASCTTFNPPNYCGDPVSATPSAPFAPFDLRVASAVGQASQNSSISPNQLSGTLRVLMGDLSSMRQASAHSLFSITFDVDVATPFSLTGSGIGGNNFNRINSLSLAQGTTSIFSVAIGSSFGEPFATSGELTPGRYTLRAELLEYLPTYQELDFQLQAVPEPRTALCFGAGLALLGLGARWRRGFARC